MEYRVRTLLPGWPALRWLNISLTCMWVGAPLAIAMGLTSAITQSWLRNPFVAVMAIGTGVSVVISLVAGIWRVQRSGKENAAGYTTVNGINQVDEVVWPTGFVVRAAGDPEISAGQKRERVAAFHKHRTEEEAFRG